MSIQRRRLSLTLISGLCVEAINKLSPLLILHHAQKSLGLAAFGWAQYSLAMLEMLQPFIAFGYNQFAMSELGKAEDLRGTAQELLSSLLALKSLHVILTVLVYGYWIAGAGSLSFADLALPLILSLTALVCDGLWYGVAQHRLAFFTLLGGISRVISLVIMLLIVRGPEDKQLFLLMMVLPNVLVSLVSGLAVLRDVGIVPLAIRRLPQMFRQAFPFACIAGILLFTERMDLFIVERWFGLEALGAYSGPARVVQSLNMMTGFIVLAFYSEILRVQDKATMLRYATLSLLCLMVVVSPMVFGAPFVEDAAMSLLFTHQAPEAKGVFSLLCGGLFGNVLLSVFGLQLMQIKGRVWQFVMALMVGLGSGLLATWFWYESYGLKGVAMGVIFAKAIASVLAILGARSLIGRIPWASIVTPLLAGSAMALALLLLGRSNLWWNVGVGAPVYLIVLAALNWSQLQHIMLELRRRFARGGTA